MNYNKKENDQSVMTVTGIDNLVTFVYVVILLYSPRLQLRHTIRGGNSRDIRCSSCKETQNFITDSDIYSTWQN
jgi:hypothetical protein